MIESSNRRSPRTRVLPTGDLRGIHRGRRRGTFPASIVLVMSLVAAFTAVPLSKNVAAANDAPTASRSTAASGLSVQTISGARYGVRTAVHVVTFSGSQYALAIGLANHEIDGGLETPSSMCKSTADCVAAVNGDFFDLTPTGKPDPGDEVGGIIQNCVLVHTPETPHQQANLDAQSVGNGLNWSSSVDVNGVTVPINAINQELPMSYPGVSLPLTGTLLYTAPYALRLPTAGGRTTYEFTQIGATTSPTTINTTVDLELVAQTTGPVYVAAGQVDISVTPGSAFAALSDGSAVTMTTSSTSGCNNIGGHTILLNDGKVLPINPADTYLTQRFARSVIGWTSSGETVIMTVNGVDGKSGATGYQLDRLCRFLHLATALDLDGGNSTVLYANGHIFSHAGTSERPVSTGLLVVESPPTS